MIENENDSELLRRYAAGQCEAAFAQLVGRYLGLVYSAALRQVAGDTAAAQDVAQTVFVDLARKASRLTKHPSLAGWLYTSTRYLAGNARREMARRAAREQIAHFMNQPQTAEPEPDWSTLQAVLDDAMHELEETDREAVLWRFFERRSFAEIGAHLGLKENSARMRVERALDKLREALRRRGITSTALGLGELMAHRAVGDIPSGLAERVRTAALAGGAAASVPLLVGLGRLFVSWKGAVLMLGSAAMVFTWLWVKTNHSTPSPGRSAQAPTRPEAELAEGVPAVPLGAVPALAARRASQTSEAGSDLQLTFVTRDSQRPVPNVEVRCWTEWGGESRAQTLRATRDGRLRIGLPTNLTELKLSTGSDGFADTALNWRTDRGETVPKAYLLRLGRASLLGGRVVDPGGNPVPDAKVTLYRSDEPIEAPRPESLTASAETTTDEQGQWQINRIAPELLRHIVLYARHTNFAESSKARYDVQTEEQLRARTHILHLGAGDSLQGTVLGPEGEPVGGATVIVGMLHYSSTRRTASAANGSFAVHGIAHGVVPVTAEAVGFAPTAVMAEVGSNTGPVSLTLSRGVRFSVRVLNQGGKPIAGAEVGIGTPSGSSTQAQFRYFRESDEQGRSEFGHLPAMTLSVTARAAGYLEACGIDAPCPGPELTLTLSPSLRVSGSVRDAATGELIPKFHLVAGRPESGGPWWSTIERFNPHFEGGVFRHEFNEGVVCDGTNTGFLLKFLADGYAPFVSGQLVAGASPIQLDVSLQPVPSGRITVLNPDGRPAAWADVGLVSRGKHDALTLLPGGLDRRYARTDGALKKTDERGQLLWRIDPEIRSAVFANSLGYLEAEVAELSDGSMLRLKPWGRIEGTLPPVLGRNSSVHLEFDPRREADIRTIMFEGYDTNPNEAGRFSFPMVPPGRNRLVELVPQPTAQPRSWKHARHLEVEVRPGETTIIHPTDHWQSYPR